MPSNHDVFQAFADGRPLRGGNVSSETLSDGSTVLMSYSTPVALHIGNAVVVDARRYSVTTSKQVTGTIMPCHHAGLSWDRIDHDAFRSLCRELNVSLAFAR